MRKVRCEICGNRIEPGYIERHHVVPTHITEKAGLSELPILRLCRNCHREVHTWYSAKVSGMTYDPGTKRFRTKPWLEMVKEYEYAFNSFMEGKKKRTKRS